MMQKGFVLLLMIGYISAESATCEFSYQGLMDTTTGQIDVFFSSTGIVESYKITVNTSQTEAKRLDVIWSAGVKRGRATFADGDSKLVYATSCGIGLGFGSQGGLGYFSVLVEYTTTGDSPSCYTGSVIARSAPAKDHCERVSTSYVLENDVCTRSQDIPDESGMPKFLFRKLVNNAKETGQSERNPVLGASQCCADFGSDKIWHAIYGLLENVCGCKRTADDLGPVQPRGPSRNAN